MKTNLSEAPEILDFKNAQQRKRILTLQKNTHIKVVDEFEDQKRELFYVNHPKELLSQKKRDFSYFLKEGKWVYLPWKSTLVHVLDKNDFEKLRTSRNHDLITPSEQKKFNKIRVGIAGLNVGNPAAVCLALEGGGNDMKFADHDGLSVSNLNRFRAGIAELGLNKVFISARQVYEINPYAILVLYERGITPENIDEFLIKPKIDVLVEEMDNLPLKILIRERAREFRIPVVMVTGSGPDVIIDVERYDLNPKLPILNGYLLQSVINPVISGAVKNFSFMDKMALARDFMGKKFLHPRLVTSFPLVGRTLAGIPQIAESSFLRGAAVTHAVRQITTSKSMPSGRYLLKLDGLKKL